MEQKEKISIPEDIQKVCKEFAEVAIKNGLYNLEGKFNPPFELGNGWSGDISFRWTAGRHNEDQNQITIWSNFQVVTKVNG
jgi:hypothetical protein